CRLTGTTLAPVRSMRERMSSIDAITVRTSVGNNNLSLMRLPRFSPLSPRWAVITVLAAGMASMLPALGAPGASSQAARAGDPLKVWITLRDKGPALRPPDRSGGDPAPGSASPGRANRANRAYEDVAVYAPYLEALRRTGVEVSTVLKWQNRVSGW